MLAGELELEGHVRQVSASIKRVEQRDRGVRYGELADGVVVEDCDGNVGALSSTSP